MNNSIADAIVKSDAIPNRKPDVISYKRCPILNVIIALLFFIPTLSSSITAQVQISCSELVFSGDAIDLNGDPRCGTYVNLSKSIDVGSNSCSNDSIDWHVSIDLWSDGTTDLVYTSIILANNTIYLALPDLIHNSCYDHTVVWTANDRCNNSSSCTELFQVEDRTAPTPDFITVSSLIFQQLQWGYMWAEDYNLNSFDDCTPAADLSYSFSATEYIPNRTLSCADDPDSDGLAHIPIYVWDNSCTPNVDSAIVIIVFSNIDCLSFIQINGRFSTELGVEVENVNVIIDSPNLIHDLNYLTDSIGYYESNALLSGFDYDLIGEKNDDFRNGLSTLDLVLIQKHILGLRLLDSPYKMIAADINSSGSITVLDLVFLRKLILGIYDEMPFNDSWRFVDASQQLSIANPWMFNEHIEIKSLNGDSSNVDFVAVKIGDVNGSVVSNATSLFTEGRTDQELSFAIEEVFFQAGETKTIEVLSSNFTDIYGFQFSMELNGIKLNKVAGISLSLNEENISTISDHMMMSYSNGRSVSTSADEVLFTMEITAKESGSLSTMLNINSSVMRAEAYFGNDLNVGEVSLDITSNDRLEDIGSYKLYQNFPNPFIEETQVSFKLAHSAKAHITIYDVTGRVVSQKIGTYAKGNHTVSLNKSDLGKVTGVLYYQLESGDFLATKKMIIVK